MLRSQDRILTTHTGSLPRPAALTSLYVRHRMSGFGGGWTRKVFADVTHYPAFMAWKSAHDAVNESISNVGGVPEAVGEVRYLDRTAVEAECADFATALDAVQGRYAEPFMTAPSPGIIA